MDFRAVKAAVTMEMVLAHYQVTGLKGHGDSRRGPCPIHRGEGEPDDDDFRFFGYVRRLRDVEAILQLLAADLRERGIFTERGRTRSTLQTFLQALDRWDRFAQRLGLDRRSKPVTDIALALRDAEDHR